MALDKEQRAKIERWLNIPYNRVTLQCDGHQIELVVVSVGGLKYRVMTYVNGKFLGKWSSAQEPCPEQKFLRKVTKPLVTKALRDKAEKIFGKREVAKDPFYHEKRTYYMPNWPSGKAALNHLCKVCKSVDLVE